MEKFSLFVLKRRWLIIVSVIILTILLGVQIPKIKINSDVVSSLPSDDKDAVLLKRIGEKFGGNRLGMIILDCENVFTTEVLQHVSQITDKISQIQHISSVTSLTNTVSIREGKDGIEIGKLVDEDNLPDTKPELDALRAQVLTSDLFRGTIVSEDGTTTIIIFTLSDEADIQEVASAVEETTREMNLPERIYYAGSPMLITSIAHLISEDMAHLFPLALLVIAVVLFLSFRSFSGVFLPLLVCIIAIVWVIGTMSLFGFEMSMVSNNIPIIILAVGSAYAIHVLHWIDHIKKTNPQKAISLALISVTVPLILAALTTMTGFMSFIFGSYLRMIRDFGLFTALGTFFSVLLSLAFVPAVVSFMRGGKGKKRTEKKAQNPLIHDYLLVPLKRVLISSPRQILLIWVVLAVFAIAGLTLIQRNVDIRNYFKKDNPMRIAEDIMTKKFGGTKPVFVHFEGDILDPEILKTMIRMEEYMKKDPEVNSTQSIADLIVAINGAFGEGEKIPDEKETVEQLWFLLDGNENVQKFITPELDEAVIISKYVSSDNDVKKKFAQYMQKFVDENSTDDCKIQVTGMPFIDSTMDRSLISSQIGSVLIAIFFVILIIGIVLRSIVSGVYAALPIMASIIILFGFMGFTKIPLNIATVLVASVAVGIGIDYSIHVITHFKNAIKKGETITQAVNETIEISGRAIVINVLSVSVGFSVLLFSELVPLEYFGLLVSLSMVGSGLGAMTLLPAILILTNRK